MDAINKMIWNSTELLLSNPGERRLTVFYSFPLFAAIRLLYLQPPSCVRDGDHSRPWVPDSLHKRQEVGIRQDIAQTRHGQPKLRRLTRQHGKEAKEETLEDCNCRLFAANIDFRGLESKVATLRFIFSQHHLPFQKKI